MIEVDENNIKKAELPSGLKVVQKALDSDEIWDIALRELFDCRSVSDLVCLNESHAMDSQFKTCLISSYFNILCSTLLKMPGIAEVLVLNKFTKGHVVSSLLQILNLYQSNQFTDFDFGNHEQFPVIKLADVVPLQGALPSRSRYKNNLKVLRLKTKQVSTINGYLNSAFKVNKKMYGLHETKATKGLHIQRGWREFAIIELNELLNPHLGILQPKKNSHSSSRLMPSLICTMRRYRLIANIVNWRTSIDINCSRLKKKDYEISGEYVKSLINIKNTK